MFAVATRTTVSCSLGRPQGPVLSLSFFDVYAQSELLDYFYMVEKIIAVWERASTVHFYLFFVYEGKVVLKRLGIYVFVSKERGGGSPKFFINTL